MFSKLFGRKPKPEPVFAYAQINARIMPTTRGDLYEDPLGEALNANGLGEVTGSGTLQQATGEIEYCGVDIEMLDIDKAPRCICDFLTKRGAPRGSELQFEIGGQKQRMLFGEVEGLAIYLNGTDLPDDVYKSCDVNVVIDSINQAIEHAAGGDGAILGHWQGPTETALYLYGKSAEHMSTAVNGFIASYPLCQRARIVRIA